MALYYDELKWEGFHQWAIFYLLYTVLYIKMQRYLMGDAHCFYVPEILACYILVIVQMAIVFLLASYRPETMGENVCVLWSKK